MLKLHTTKLGHLYLLFIQKRHISSSPAIGTWWFYFLFSLHTFFRANWVQTLQNPFLKENIKKSQFSELSVLLEAGYEWFNSELLWPSFGLFCQVGCEQKSVLSDVYWLKPGCVNCIWQVFCPLKETEAAKDKTEPERKQTMSYQDNLCSAIFNLCIALRAWSYPNKNEKYRKIRRLF